MDFSRLFDTLPGLVWTALPDGRADFVNQRWCDYTGLGADEARGDGWRSAIHPDDRPHLVERWVAATRSGEPGELEARMRRADGAWRWFLFRFSPHADETGAIVRWCGVNTDIEELRGAETAVAGVERGARLRAEAMLAAEKHLLEMVALGAPLAEVLEALCHTVEAHAPGCLCSILSIDPDGKRFRHGGGPSLPPAYNDQLDGLVMDYKFGPCGMAANWKTQVIAADVAADPRWAASAWPGMVLEHGLKACWSTPILSGDNEVIGVFALYRREAASPTPQEQDLTRQFAHIASIAIERAHHDASLRQSNARKAAILNSALDCIITIDEAGAITEFNPAAERTFGYARATVMGRPLAETIIPPSLRDAHRQGLARYLATGEDVVLGRRIELVAMRADGSEFPVELAITRNPEDGPASFTGVLRDITERRRAEAQLGELRSDLAHMARVTSLGALTASIAHEVNQPLSGIITNASACLRMLAADPPNIDGAADTARRTLRDGDRAADIVRRLRQLFARHDGAQEAVDLNEAAREVIALASGDLLRRRVVLQTAFAEALPPVAGDRVQLQQVILNLIVNAADAMADVEDRPRRLEVRTALDGGDRVKLTVQDAGVGLAPEAAARLFEAFYTTKPEGMGIGLSVSRSIVESHGGHLSAEPNADGPGARFIIDLPRQAA